MPITPHQTDSSSPVRKREPEDPLSHLPCGRISEFRKNEIIYGHEEPPRQLFLVIDGRVKVSRITPENRHVILDVYRTDDLFGEGAFIRSAVPHGETAVAFDNVKLMTWDIAEVEELVAKRPKLGIALLQLVAQRASEYGCRIESFSVDTIPQRLARSLLRLCDRLGQQAEDGSVQMIPLTHEFLSQYVGTSREIVTHHMNDFRRQGFLQYSRRGILLERAARQEWFKRTMNAAA
ncbi:MAG: Crp/Fnr family transcriptional regulator [Acidobacteriota bacterium]